MVFTPRPMNSIPAMELFASKDTPRTGVDYAGEEWAARPYRLLISGGRVGIEKDPAGR